MSEGALLTYADLEKFPADGLRRELLDGELIVSPSPKTRHQELVLRLAIEISNHLQISGGGRLFIAPLDVLLSDSNVTEPDLFFVAAEHDARVGASNVQGAPDLVIEVLSDPRLDRVRKRQIYARFGVPEYWIVDPDADRVEVHILAGSTYAKPLIFEPGDALTYERLPGLALDLASLFAR